MESVIVAVVLLFMVFMALGAVLTVRTVRAVRRGVDRTGTQVRRTVEEAAIKARSVQPGPIGELARRRLELRSSIDGTRRALEAGVSRDPSLRESLTLLDRLHEHARVLDRELRLMMDGEPDRNRAAARLPEIRDRVAGIRQSADSLRHAAQERALRHDAEGLADLHAQIEIEAGALRHWQRPADAASSATPPADPPATPLVAPPVSPPSATPAVPPSGGRAPAAPPPGGPAAAAPPPGGPAPAGPHSPGPGTPRPGKGRPRNAS